MKRNKHMKLPNGFGQITKLKGNLRNPYRVMTTVGISAEGRPICKILKPKGYFETYNDAYYALMEYHKNPYDLAKEMTLEQVYDQWSERHFKTISESMQKSYKTSWNRLSELKDVPMRDIKPMQIRDVLENMSSVAGQKTKILLNLLFDYAEENEIVAKNYARITKVKFENETKHHITFTDEEMSALWAHTDDFWTRYVLIQCYTGLRPGELVDLQIENISLENNCIVGGKKTKAGKNRQIPIHPAIKPLIEQQLKHFGKIPSGKFFRNENGKPIQIERYRIQFKNIIKELNLNPEHKSHDPRKFFVSQAKKYQLDEYAIKLIVGHAIEDITESVYTDRPFDWLYSEICKIQCTNNV